MDAYLFKFKQSHTLFESIGDGVGRNCVQLAVWSDKGTDDVILKVSRQTGVIQSS